MKHDTIYEVFRIAGKFLKNKTEEKMPTSFRADCIRDAENYVEIKQNAASNIITEIDGVKSYYSTFVIRGRKTTWTVLTMKISELIKQLNECKELHGDVEAVVYNPEYAKYDTIVRIYPVYPGPTFEQDKTKPAWGVCLSDY